MALRQGISTEGGSQPHRCRAAARAVLRPIRRGTRSAGPGEAEAPRYTDVVIDAGGHDSTTLRAALTLCDAVLVPYPPRTMDVWALADMAKLVEEARSMRAGLLALAVLNIADPGVSADNIEAVAALADVPQLTGLKASITRRKAFPNAAGFGLSVEETTPRDPKACEELAALATEVAAMVSHTEINGVELNGH